MESKSNLLRSRVDKVDYPEVTAALGHRDIHFRLGDTPLSLPVCALWPSLSNFVFRQFILFNIYSIFADWLICVALPAVALQGNNQTQLLVRWQRWQSHTKSKQYKSAGASWLDWFLWSRPGEQIRRCQAAVLENPQDHLPCFWSKELVGLSLGDRKRGNQTQHPCLQLLPANNI